MSAPIPPQRQPSAPKPPSHPDSRRQEANRALLVQAGLLGVTMLAFSLPLPFTLLAAVAGLTAVGVGIRSWLRLRPVRPPHGPAPQARSDAQTAGSRGDHSTAAPSPASGSADAAAVAFTRAMIGLGVVVAAAATVLSLSPLLAWEASIQFQQCLDSALTERSRASCQNGFESHVQRLVPAP